MARQIYFSIQRALYMKPKKQQPCMHWQNTNHARKDRDHTTPNIRNRKYIILSENDNIFCEISPPQEYLPVLLIVYITRVSSRYKSIL